MAPKNRWLLALFAILMSLVFYLIFIYTMALESGWKNLEVSDFFGLIIFLPFTIGMFLCMCFAKEIEDQRPTEDKEKTLGKENLGKTEERAESTSKQAVTSVEKK